MQKKLVYPNFAVSQENLNILNNYKKLLSIKNNLVLSVNYIIPSVSYSPHLFANQPIQHFIKADIYQYEFLPTFYMQQKYYMLYKLISNPILFKYYIWWSKNMFTCGTFNFFFLYRKNFSNRFLRVEYK